MMFLSLFLLQKIQTLGAMGEGWPTLGKLLVEERRRRPEPTTPQVVAWSRRGGDTCFVFHSCLNVAFAHSPIGDERSSARVLRAAESHHAQ
uniref:Putative secreted protein n=1 Tax=Anopheles triannulatus TaxID=58253 RepID=A0A2M4B4D3_9DIPT